MWAKAVQIWEVVVFNPLYDLDRWLAYLPSILGAVVVLKLLWEPLLVPVLARFGVTSPLSCCCCCCRGGGRRRGFTDGYNDKGPEHQV